MCNDLNKLTVGELTSSNVITDILENCDENNIEEIKQTLMEVAKDKRVARSMKKNLREYDLAKKYQNNDVGSLLDFDVQGNVRATVPNYVTILENDEEFKNLFIYDEFSKKTLKCESNGTLRIWTDSDDSDVIYRIQDKYDMRDKSCYYDAFNVVVANRHFHPIKELIENQEWDRKPRIDRFLIDILGCEDNDYYREVSRMIFYGGISRIYQPGCKFDYMPIFIGKQGQGKTTIVKWLALNDSYYNDISSIEGKDALENIQGTWICELSELLAMVRTKDIEAMKSFVTRTVDKFRESYGKRSNEYPRTCIFIGTTNDYQFLSDKTGNRRYLPVELNIKMGEIYRKEIYIKDYIMQCWREALVLYKEHKAYLTIPQKYYKDVVNAQNNAVEDDPKVGMILDYLDKKEIGDRVCNIEIFTNCLNGLKKNFDRLQSKEISRILASLPDWGRGGNTNHRFEVFGQQRYWEKIIPKDDWSDLD